MNCLVIEDNIDHYDLIEDALEQANFSHLKVEHETSLTSGLRTLDNHEFDICLCDLVLDDSDINSTVEQLKILDESTPIIILTSLNDIGIAKGLLQEGIQDYLSKDELSPTLLHRMITYAIERQRQQLLLQQENADMRTFCASLSHDFNAHLRRINMINNWMHESFSKQIKLNDEELEWFRFIQSSSTGIQELVKSLQQFLLAGYGSTHMAKVDLRELFLSVRHDLEEVLLSHAELTIDENWPTVVGNAAQLSILFQNIVINGIKYNENEPKIHISANLDDFGRYCLVAISDNGIGIEEKDFARIFKSFQRVYGTDRYNGSGLGLSIAKRIAEKHQGSISVKSVLNEGTIVTVKLPISEEV